MPLKIYGYVSGASFMIRKNIFDLIGGFDKDIFMYAEESLLCYKVINDLKYNIYNIPSSKIIHFEGESMKDSSIYCNMFLEVNYIYYKKLFGEKEAISFIKKEYRIANKKSKLYKLINKRKYNELYNYSKICKNKLDSIKNNQ
jgi:GT2 family glycosyltransferase